MTLVHSLAIVALLPLAGTIPRPEPVRGLMEFLDRVAEYVEIRRQVTAGVDGPAFCSDLEELSRLAEQRAAAIRDARPLAREGAIFTLRVAEFFRARIAQAAKMGATDVTSATERDHDVVLEVKATLPWGAGALASARLVAQLPPLPASWSTDWLVGTSFSWTSKPISSSTCCERHCRDAWSLSRLGRLEPATCIRSCRSAGCDARAREGVRHDRLSIARDKNRVLASGATAARGRGHRRARDRGC